MRDRASRCRFLVSTFARFVVRFYVAPAPTRRVTVQRARSTFERILSAILDGSPRYPVRDQRPRVARVRPRFRANDVYVPALLLGTAPGRAHVAPARGAGDVPGGTPHHILVAALQVALVDGTIGGIPYSACDLSLVSPSPTMMAQIASAQRWITIPPPPGGGSKRLVAHFAAAGWITTRAPLTQTAPG